jgi:enoyl-CoA hydratase/carnithine racemase
MPAVETESRGRVLIVRMDRGGRQNAITAAMVEALDGVLDAWDGHRVLLLTGTSTCFSAGADLDELRTLPREHAYAFSRRLQALTDKLAGLPILTVAAVEGYALGLGMELALACDLRVASERALFGVPEVRLGLFPAAGGTARLTEMLGPSLAAELLLTGEPRPVDRFPPGFCARLTAPGDAERVAGAWAEELVDYSPFAVSAIKRLLRVARDVSHAAALEWEASLFADVLGTSEVEAALDAFLARPSHQRSGADTEASS